MAADRWPSRVADTGIDPRSGMEGPNAQVTIRLRGARRD